MRYSLARFNMRKNKVSRRLSFSGIEFFFWAACSTYYPYFVVFLRDRGLSNTTIGTIAATISAVVVIAHPFWGLLSDLMKSVKKVFIIAITAAAILIFTLPLYQKALFLGLILALITFFESPLMSLLDSWLVRTIKNDPGLNYGTIRLWGSVGFALMVLVMGFIIDRFGIEVIFWIYAAWSVLAVLACLLQKDVQPETAAIMKNFQPGSLFKNKPYLFFIILATVIFMPHRASMVFMPNLFEQINGSSREYGFAYFIAATSEIPVFIFSGRLLNKLKPQYLVGISLPFFVLRQFLYSLVTTPAQAILIQLLHGLSLGLFLAGAVYYVYDLAPDHLKATAQTLATSMYFGLSGIVGNLAGGWIIDNYSLQIFYQTGCAISIAAAILFFIDLLKGRKRVISP